jgi:hypothetical protein
VTRSSTRLMWGRRLVRIGRKRRARRGSFSARFMGSLFVSLLLPFPKHWPSPSLCSTHSLKRQPCLLKCDLVVAIRDVVESPYSRQAQCKSPTNQDTT